MKHGGRSLSTLPVMIGLRDAKILEAQWRKPDPLFIPFMTYFEKKNPSSEGTFFHFLNIKNLNAVKTAQIC
jgi:hypothetical protein